MMLHKRIIFVACQEVIIAKHGQWVEIIPEVYFMSIFVLFTKISVIFSVYWQLSQGQMADFAQTYLQFPLWQWVLAMFTS